MKVALSILTADFMRVNDSLKEIINDVDYVHMDIMDGEFVPNISFGPAIVKSLRPMTKVPFDTHLMILHPQNYIKQFAEAGSQYITFHVEADCDVLETINLIKSYNVKAGISIKPNTSVEEIEKYLPYLDLVLVMSVHPGKGGQSFIDITDRVKRLREFRRRNDLSYVIEVDGE